eukprot:2008707-Amphidinium_carterae.2
MDEWGPSQIAAVHCVHPSSETTERQQRRRQCIKWQCRSRIGSIEFAPASCDEEAREGGCCVRLEGVRDMETCSKRRRRGHGGGNPEQSDEAATCGSEGCTETSSEEGEDSQGHSVQPDTDRSDRKGASQSEVAPLQTAGIHCTLVEIGGACVSAYCRRLRS